MILYVGGNPINYDGGANLFFLRRWISGRLKPKSRGIGTIEDFDYFLNKFFPN